MRVNIDHTETTTGLLRKTTHYVVTTSVEFSDEEKHIIRSKRLGDAVVMDRGVPSDKNPEKFIGNEDIFILTIDRLLSGPDKFALPTPLEAKEYEASMKEQLTLLKDYINENAGVETQSTSFEL